MSKLLRIIDSTNERLGLAMRWLVIAAILVMVIEVAQRYFFHRPTMWGYEIPVQVGAAMYVLSWGYVHFRHGHVRVDVFYSRFPPRSRAIVDVACFLLLFVPVIGFLMYTSGAWMARAWEIGEKSVLTYWYPPIAPLRTAIFLGILFLLLQGIADFIRDLHLLVRGKPYD
jgi:TRAP-type mannitol/chloroaromatic compound transport system permease small subunit